jgi:hypothetical protein
VASWLEQRHYADLDPRAEQALRAAGLCWHDEIRANAWLQQAAEIAPGHMAVVVAHYRYHLYKHRFEEARAYARQCLSLASAELNLPADPSVVTSAHANFAAPDPRLRFWLFALQAYGYVLLRCGWHEAGMEALRKVVQLDCQDQTKSRVLVDVIARAGTDYECD